ncbi:hypothetical protein [Amycolatopsis ultiminotia]
MTEVWLRSFTTALPTVRREHDNAVRKWFSATVSAMQYWVRSPGTR